MNAASGSIGRAGLMLRDQRGLALRACASAYPSELVGASARLDAAGAYAELLGAEWREQLSRAGHELDFVERAHGVQWRDWMRASALTSIELGVCAAKRALERAGWRATEVELLVAATSTPQHATKCFAAQLGAALGSNAAALDVRGGGAGGLDAWITAALYLRAGARRALVVAVESVSPWLDASSGASALLYGDGAAALALERVDADEHGGLALALQARVDVEGAPFTVPGSLPPEHARDAGASRYRFQAPDSRYQAGVAQAWSEFAHEFARVAGAASSSLFVPYAVTSGQVRACAQALGADASFALRYLNAHGSLGCAGPLAVLAQALEAGVSASSLTAIAVGGGVRCAALRWDLGSGAGR